MTAADSESLLPSDRPLVDERLVAWHFLAALGFMGFTNIHRMNGLKNWGGLCMNVVAAATFALRDIVNWPVAIAMAAGAIAGGYGGSRLAQRVPQEWVRRAVVIVGFAAAVWLAS